MPAFKIGRRGFIAGLSAAFGLVVAPALVRASSLEYGLLRGPKLGQLHVRMLGDLDVARLDVLYGLAGHRPEWEPLDPLEDALWRQWRIATEDEIRKVVSRNGGIDFERAKRFAQRSSGSQFKLDMLSDEYLCSDKYQSTASRMRPMHPDDIQISDLFHPRDWTCV
jgi:hypothetical protein